MLSCGMVQWCMIWYGIVWYGTVRYEMVWYATVWYGMVGYGRVWYGMVWNGMVRYGMVWYGMVWNGMEPRVLSRASDLPSPSCPPDWSPVNSNRSTPNSSLILILLLETPLPLRANSKRSTLNSSLIFTMIWGCTLLLTLSNSLIIPSPFSKIFFYDCFSMTKTRDEDFLFFLECQE